MSTPNSVFRTNYFTVTDESKYENIIEKIKETNEIYDHKEVINGKTFHMFGGYDTSFGIECSENDNPEDTAAAELQTIIPDNEAILIMENVDEKLRYVHAGCWIITNKEIKYIWLHEIALETAKQMLGNPKWNTTLEY